MLDIINQELHVHFEDDVKLSCPRRNCTFSFHQPKVTGKTNLITKDLVMSCHRVICSGGDSLTRAEMMKSHMALKHRERQYEVSPEILQTWGGNSQRSHSRPVRKAVKTSEEIR